MGLLWRWDRASGVLLGHSATRVVPIPSVSLRALPQKVSIHSRKGGEGGREGERAPETERETENREIEKE